MAILEPSFIFQRFFQIQIQRSKYFHLGFQKILHNKFFMPCSNQSKGTIDYILDWSKFFNNLFHHFWRQVQNACLITHFNFVGLTCLRSNLVLSINMTLQSSPVHTTKEVHYKGYTTLLPNTVIYDTIASTNNCTSGLVGNGPTENNVQMYTFYCFPAKNGGGKQRSA